MSTADAAAAMREAMAEAGIVTDAAIVADGALHRVHVEGDKRGSRNGWYKLHPDDPPAGAFGSWRLGITDTWCAGSNGSTSPEERAAFARKVEARKRQQADEQQQRHAAARERAEKLWEQAKPANPEHPYLRSKGVAPHGIRQRGDTLLIPVRGADGTLRGLQRIWPSGRKMFSAGTEAKGAYHGIGTPDGALVVAEGYATAASIHATGHAVAVAFSAGNLQPVAEALRRKFGPDMRIIVAADNDLETEGNPGVTAAREAARAVGGTVATPRISGDLNDLAAQRGPEAVRAAIDAAKKPPVVVDEAKVEAEVGRLRVAREARRRLDAEDGETAEVQAWTMAELLADPSIVELPPPVVPRLAWPARSTLLVGREMSGKSTFAGAAAADVSARRRWLDQETTAGHVLWAGEECPGDVVRRLRGFGARPENVTVMVWGADPVAEIRAHAERVRPVLTVIDTLQAIAEHARPDSGRASDWAAIMRPLVRLARDTGTALVILHHARKSDGAYRDSTEIAAAVDVVVTMSGGTDSLRRLEWEGRYGRGAYAVRLSGHRYTLLDTEDDGEAIADEIMRFVAAHPGTGSTAITGSIKARDRDILRTLADLVAAGRLADDGTEHRHRYRVPDPARSGQGSGADHETLPTLPTLPDARQGESEHDGLAAEPTLPTPTQGVGRVAERGCNDSDELPI